MTTQFLIGIDLVRLLGPEVFEVIAIGWLMVGVGNLMADKIYSRDLFGRVGQTAPLKQMVIFDGRNLFVPDNVAALGIEYHGIGR